MDGNFNSEYRRNKRIGRRLTVYEGDAMVLSSTECQLKDDAAERKVLDTFELSLVPNRLSPRDTPLVALAEGMGLRRNTPRLRRFLG